MLEHSKIYKNNDELDIKEIFENNEIVAKYGIPCLDNDLKGILKSDLILIGASTGCGKSTIAKLIAEENAKNNKEITVISLENFKGDDFLENLFQEYKTTTKNYNIDIIDFINLYQQNGIEKKSLKIAEQKTRERYKNISYIYREEEDYTTEQLKEDVKYIFRETQTDLIILDHVDYLDKECGENDIDHITKLMSTIRSMQLVYKIPMVCISHLRKNNIGNVKNPVLIPSLDDFIGSSNKTKIATVVIILSPDEDVKAERNIGLKNYEKPTFCCIRKHRKLGRKVVGYAKRIIFDLRMGKYDSEKITNFQVNYTGNQINEIEKPLLEEKISIWGGKYE